MSLLLALTAVTPPEPPTPGGSGGTRRPYMTPEPVLNDDEITALLAALLLAA